jgi:protein arginine N-methyltransferase 1
MYSIAGYGEMIADQPRMRAYAEALRRTVQPSTVVLDIGTGTGIFALLAARLDARKVYAIEPSYVIEVARATAAANGCADRITFIQALSTEVALEEPADLVVSDLRGILPPFGHHIPSIVDARRRLLAPGGTLIPGRDSVQVAVVEAPELYRRHMGPWADRPFDLDLEVARQLVANSWCKCRVQPEELLLEPRTWAVLDYSTVESPDVRGELTWTAWRGGLGHGLLVWFDTVLLDDVGFSNAPDAPETIYGSAFFPWPEPVRVEPQDTVGVTLEARLVGEEYLWRWDTMVLSRGRPAAVKARFSQSTFFGEALGSAQLRKQAAGYAPTLNRDGQVNRVVLEMMNGGTPLRDIAQALAERFPDKFADATAALVRVGSLSLQYGD